MSTSQIHTGAYQRLFNRWKEHYIIRVQVISQLVSFLAAVIGILYIWLNAGLTQVQMLHLASSLLLLVAIANFLLPVFTLISTRLARKRIKDFFKDIPADSDYQENQAWRQALTFPWQLLPAELMTVSIQVVIPVAVHMSMNTGTTIPQTIHIIIGGFISGTLFTIHNVLYIDQALAPVRQALLPQKPEGRLTPEGMGLNTRIQIVVGGLLVFAVLLVSPLGYQKIILATSQGVDSLDVLRDFVLQLVALSLIAIILGIALVRLLARSISRPIRNVIDVMEKSLRGDLSDRARILTSGETTELAIRFNQMLDQLESTRTDLERRVDQRTAALERKTAQLQAASMIARQAASFQDVTTLLEETVNLITEKFGFYHAGIFLLDEYEEYAVLQSASSEGGKNMLTRSHRLQIGRQGIVGATAFDNRAHVALDVTADIDFEPNPDLPKTRSEVALPLSIRKKVIGVLDIQSTEPEAFLQDDIELLQTMADQIALAIQNAQLLTDSQNTLKQLQSIMSEDVREAWRERVRQQRRGYRFTPLGTSSYTPTPGHTGMLPSQPPDPMGKLEIPVTLRGQQIGMIRLQRKTKAPWFDSDQFLAVEIANQIGLALENTRLLEETQSRAAQEQILSELTAQLSRSLEPDTLLQGVTRELYRLPNIEEVSVFIKTPETESSLPTPDE